MDKHYNDYVQIGLNIMRYRKEAGYTQLQLAEMTGYSHQHIQRVETASSKPTVGLLLDVSQGSPCSHRAPFRNQTCQIIGEPYMGSLFYSSC